MGCSPLAVCSNSPRHPRPVSGMTARLYAFPTRLIRGVDWETDCCHSPKMSLTSGPKPNSAQTRPSTLNLPAQSARDRNNLDRSIAQLHTIRTFCWYFKAWIWPATHSTSSAAVSCSHKTYVKDLPINIISIASSAISANYNPSMEHLDL